MELELVAAGLKFPEGPIAMADGSIILVEIQRGTLSRPVLISSCRAFRAIG